MSNIFEIDGEIEDNNDENGGQKNSDENNNEDESKEFSPIEDASTDSDEDAGIVSNESEDTEPWYNKYIDDDDDKVDSESLPEQDLDTETSAEDSNGDDIDGDLPTVDDISQEEIDEVLAEIDEDEKEYDQVGGEGLESVSEIEAQNLYEDDVDDEHETFDQVFPSGHRKPVAMGTWIFLVLFLISLSLFAYYQFYDGKRFSITFKHRSSAGISQIDSIATKYKMQIEELENQQKIIAQLRDKIEKLHALNLDLAKDTAGQSNLLNSNGTPSKASADISKGTFFQVQLIALQQYHPSFGESEIAFYIDKEDGFSKMLMGAFVNEEQAKILYEKVRKAGFDDAFIVKKIDGRRVEYAAFK